MTKNVIVGLLILVAGAQANATSMKRYLEADLTSFRFQPGSVLANRRINGGNVQIDFMAKTITLTLNPAFHCPAGAACALVMPAPQVVTLPLTKVTTGHCNQNIFIARENNLPVDGIDQTLTVIDNSNNHCKYLVAIPATEVRLHQVGGRRPMDERHVMYGKHLN